jgi:uncharacterized protein with von Willebrand factor type A (vWA) domain
MASLSVQVSGRLLQSLKRRATEQCRSLDKEVADLIAAGLQRSDAGGNELEELLQPLELMTDGDLWNAAKSRLPRRLSGELEKLHQKRQTEGNTSAEQERARVLTAQFERCLVIRARAIELLHARGHDVSRLLPT